MKHLSLTPELYDYMLNVSLHEHPELKALRKETEKLPLAVMQAAPEQAQFMQLLLKILDAEQVLEVGTFTGYSTLSMALALPENGKIVTCDINDEWTSIGKPFWQEAHQDHKIELRMGEAVNTLNQMLDEGYRHSFDFIFIDADKSNYVHYYELALQLIKPKGLIAIDNVLWGGKVIDLNETGSQTKAIRKLNELIKNDDRVSVSLLPIADGVFLVKPK